MKGHLVNISVVAARYGLMCVLMPHKRAFCRASLTTPSISSTICNAYTNYVAR